jgi:hypothetical protein
LKWEPKCGFSVTALVKTSFSGSRRLEGNHVLRLPAEIQNKRGLGLTL